MFSSRALQNLSILSGASFRLFIRGIHGGIVEGGREEANSIHPTALVHRNAILGKRVSVGPFCTVGSEVQIGNACHLHAGSHVTGNTVLGDNCTVLSGAIVGADLPGRTIIGCNNVIGYHAVVGVKCQDLKYKVGDECFLIVGDNNDIREFTSIHRSSKSCDTTVIGDGNLIMGSCHIAHDCKVGFLSYCWGYCCSSILSYWIILFHWWRICVNASHVMVRMLFCMHSCEKKAVKEHLSKSGNVNSTISQDVPKYMMVSGDRAEIRGLNLEGLRRNGFSSEEVQTMRKAYRKIFMSSDTATATGCFEDRLSEVEQNRELFDVSIVCSMVKSIRDSFKGTRRGICKFRNLFGSSREYGFS